MDEMVQKVLEQQEQVEVVNSGMKGNYVPPYGLFGFIQPDLQVLSFLEVCDWDNMTSVIIDRVELRDPVNRTRQIIKNAANGKLRLESRTFDLLLGCS